MKKTMLLLLTCLYVSTRLLAQPMVIAPDSITEFPSIQLHHTQQKITLDGLLDEEAWYTGSNSSRFWQHFPYDTLSASGQTQVFMTYDDNNLYVGVKCYSIGERYVTPSLRRDYNFSGSDNITLVIDTYNDKTNAFVFGINPYGVLREALISNGGRQFQDFASSWDNKWFGEAKIHGDYWIGEFAIPFKTLRFTEGSEQWRFNCYRSDTQVNEWSSWVRIPRNFLIMDLAYMGEMNWDKPLKKPGTNISIIPYALTSMSRDFEDANQEQPEYDLNFGGDAKIAVTPGLNLDLTINPDFSQVEVDEQVTNLNRFEILFPEKRQFFLENADLFGTFGQRRVNPFFSRRIGIEVDSATGQNIQTPILYGARLSGKLNENLRLGVMNMQTAKQTETGLPGFNFTVAALQQQVFDRSNISLMFVNKQAVNAPVDTAELFNNYNRVMALEYRLATANNRWTGKFFHHQAFTPLDKSQKLSNGLQVEYNRRKYRLEWAQLLVGYGYDAEVGFVPRRDYFLMSPEFEWRFYPTNGILNQHSFALDTRFFLEVGNANNPYVSDFEMSERQTELTWEFQFINNTRGMLTATEIDVTLLEDFDPTRLQPDSVFLPAGSRYHYIFLEGEYTSDQRKRFFFQIEPNIGQFYNGFRAGLKGSFTLRYQPYGFISIAYDYNYIELAGPFQPVNIWLIGPRIDLTLSKKIFLTAFIQYNNQLNNLNINTRFQWRFQPVSDFFLVYTDNYITDPFSQFGVRNRSLVAKVTYWLNL